MNNLKEHTVLALVKKNTSDNFFCDDSFLLFAAKNYNNPHCHTMEEFYSDIQIPTHIKKLFRRFKSNDDLQERLILNHFVAFFNVFDTEPGAKILFHKLEKEYHDCVKSVLFFLGRCPSAVYIGDELINIHALPKNENLYEKLKKI